MTEVPIYELFNEIKSRWRPQKELEILGTWNFPQESSGRKLSQHKSMVTWAVNFQSHRNGASQALWSISSQYTLGAGHGGKQLDVFVAEDQSHISLIPFNFLISPFWNGNGYPVLSYPGSM